MEEALEKLRELKLRRHSNDEEEEEQQNASYSKKRNAERSQDRRGNSSNRRITIEDFHFLSTLGKPPHCPAFLTTAYQAPARSAEYGLCDSGTTRRASQWP